MSKLKVWSVPVTYETEYHPVVATSAKEAVQVVMRERLDGEGSVGKPQQVLDLASVAAYDWGLETLPWGGEEHEHLGVCEWLRIGEIAAYGAESAPGLSEGERDAAAERSDALLSSIRKEAAAALRKLSKTARKVAHR